ncbi:hypothetical protein PIB30_063159 [Stylosanthes scabra]|uniref:Uncharacterized protein n=1 Tax=Stylosanthes scabra TaxID=79078 RepID=A0ABU6WJK6_9FABA|nr:hypothetical protein [Stylosanthes scabra]
MCEELRCYLMHRMAKHARLLGNYPGKLAPVQQKRLDKLIHPSNRWTEEWACDDPRMTFQRPIVRPKMHTRERDPGEDVIEGNKLKKTFRVTCSKCGDNGHNFKTYKGAPAKPNWKPHSRKNRRGASSSGPPAEIQISQSALPPKGEFGNDQNQAQDTATRDMLEHILGNDA